MDPRFDVIYPEGTPDDESSQPQRPSRNKMGKKIMGNLSRLKNKRNGDDSGLPEYLRPIEEDAQSSNSATQKKTAKRNGTDDAALPEYLRPISEDDSPAMGMQKRMGKFFNSLMTSVQSSKNSQSGQSDQSSLQSSERADDSYSSVYDPDQSSSDYGQKTGGDENNTYEGIVPRKKPMSGCMNLSIPHMPNLSRFQNKHNENGHNSLNSEDDDLNSSESGSRNGAGPKKAHPTMKNLKLPNLKCTSLHLPHSRPASGDSEAGDGTAG